MLYYYKNVTSKMSLLIFCLTFFMVNMQHALNTVFQNSEILDGTYRSQSCQSSHMTSTHDLKNWPNKTFYVEIQTKVCFLHSAFLHLSRFISLKQLWQKGVKILGWFTVPVDRYCNYTSDVRRTFGVLTHLHFVNFEQNKKNVT